QALHESAIARLGDRGGIDAADVVRGIEGEAVERLAGMIGADAAEGFAGAARDLLAQFGEAERHADGTPVVAPALSTVAQRGSYPHQDNTQHILPRAVAAIAPVAIVLGMLDDRGVPRGEQRLAQLGMLRKLGPYNLAHDVVLHRLPVRPDPLAAVASHARRDHRRLLQTDGFLVLRARELLRLEIMLGRRPELALQVDRIMREVGEAAV